jgi:hypothetical protein
LNTTHLIESLHLERKNDTTHNATSALLLCY